VGSGGGAHNGRMDACSWALPTSALPPRVAWTGIGMRLPSREMTQLRTSQERMTLKRCRSQVAPSESHLASSARLRLGRNAKTVPNGTRRGTARVPHATRVQACLASEPNS
jgi:hypothetical protein